MIKVKVQDNLERYEPILVPLNSTIREALEQVEVNYRNTMIEIDHHSIDDTDLDKTFAEMGVEEESVTFLTCITKLNNAVRIVKFNDTYVIQVDFGREDIVELEESAPDMLKLWNDNMDEDFRVTYGAEPEVSKYGICFATENNDHQCSIAVRCEDDAEFSEEYGRIVKKLKDIEIKATEFILGREEFDVTGMIETM